MRHGRVSYHNRAADIGTLPPFVVLLTTVLIVSWWFAQVLAAGAVAVLSPAPREAAAVGIGTAAKSYGNNAAVSAMPPGRAVAATAGNRSSKGEEAVSAAAAAAGEEGRWSDLETWLDCSLSALEACTRCVNWASAAGYIGGLAYVRLFSLVLRLLFPVTRGGGGGGDNGHDRLLFEGGCGAVAGGALDGAGGGERLEWARERLAQVVDDLMWRLREGLPGRDVRLRLLQVCTIVRCWRDVRWLIVLFGLSCWGGCIFCWNGPLKAQTAACLYGNVRCTAQQPCSTEERCAPPPTLLGSALDKRGIS